ncbi:MAG: hypothetical protein KJ600_03480 [Nanoarchaeota archaeon]|nr:hypothetical protein [Nanoarchaeota archaeon]MBU1103589.1 hypothetical protein [Nanoarchaeota archaeon]
MEEDILKKLLKKIITDYAGPDAEKLVDFLYKKQNVNEFAIAKKLEMTINQTRNMLYKLADSGLVQFIRKKDKKKGGWYTYFWTLKAKRSVIKYKEKIANEIEVLKNNLQRLQREQHFFCKNCELEYSEENALTNDYTCPECGETLEMKDTTKINIQIESQTKRLKDTLERIEKEISLIEEKELKTKEKRIKGEQKEKEEERKRRRKEREKEKKKELKEQGKSAKVKKPKSKEKMKKKSPKKSKKAPSKKTRSSLFKKFKQFSKKRKRK